MQQFFYAVSAQAEAGAPRREFEPVDLSAVVRDVARVAVAPAFKIGTASISNEDGVLLVVTKQPAANTLELTATSSEGGPHIDNIGVSSAIAEPPGTVINVSDHGAVGDGSIDNTRAIADAIAAEASAAPTAGLRRRCTMPMSAPTCATTSS